MYCIHQVVVGCVCYIIILDYKHHRTHFTAKKNSTVYIYLKRKEKWTVNACMIRSLEHFSNIVKIWRVYLLYISLSLTGLKWFNPPPNESKKAKLSTIMIKYGSELFSKMHPSPLQNIKLKHQYYYYYIIIIIAFKCQQWYLL